MNTYTDSRLITISSETADTIYNETYLSSCQFNFPNMLKDEDDILYTTISVQSAQIPISYYIINEYNNRLFYQIGTGAISSVEFAAGNYNATSFIDEMKNKIPSISVVLDKTTGKLKFARNGSFKLLWLGSTCFHILGLNETQDYNVSTSPYNLTAPYPCQFQGTTRIKIASDILATYSMDSRYKTFSNTLACIPVNSGSYGILLYENTSIFKPLLREKTINFFDIAFYDNEDNLINFNNIPWSLTIQLDIIRELKKPDKVFPYGPKMEPQVDNTGDDKKAELPDVQDLEPVETTDADLDFLLYQNGINW